MPIISHLLLSLFAIGPSSGEVFGDACDVRDPRFGASAYCQPHVEGAPVFDATVCCAEGACFAAPEGLCLIDEELLYCELGEQRADDQVDCYFEVPEYCDVFPCEPGYQAHPQGAFMCCHGGICWTTYVESNDCEPQDIYWCDSGVSNDDGTVTCLDD